jgi:hypothetical protein
MVRSGLPLRHRASIARQRTIWFSRKARAVAMQYGQLLVASRLDALLEFLVLLNFTRK